MNQSVKTTCPYCGVGCGVVVSSLVFAWEKSKRIRFTVKVNSEGVKVYEINGPLFFGSAKSFQEIFDRKSDPKLIIIDFKHSRVCDHSGIEVISSILKKYNAHGMEVKLKNLSPDCKYAVEKAGVCLKDRHID